jgi:hypothetical protein
MTWCWGRDKSPPILLFEGPLIMVVDGLPLTTIMWKLGDIDLPKYGNALTH